MTELIELPKKGEVAALSTDEGIDKLVGMARDAIYKLEGGNIETAAGRTQIKSNAHKSNKLNAELKRRINDLIGGIESKIRPDIDKISPLKSGKSRLHKGLTGLAGEVREDVKAKEAEVAEVRSVPSPLAVVPGV